MEDFNQQIKQALVSWQTLKKNLDPFAEKYDKQTESGDSLQKDIYQALADKVMQGVNESDDMMFLFDFISNLESERAIIKYHVSKMRQENSSLHEQLDAMKKSNLEHISKILELEETIKSLEFKIELYKYDLPETNAEENANSMVKKAPADQGVGESDREENEADMMIMTQSQTLPGQANSQNYELPSRLRTLYNLVIQYANNGRFEVAVPLCKQALGDLERDYGHDHPDVATMLNILALVYRDQGKYREAAQLLNDALEIREKTLGPDHPAVASTLNNLAVLYGKRGRFKEAEPMCKRALAIREKVLGKEHPDVAKQLNNLALLCQNQSKFEEVELYYLRALEIYIKVYGTEDPIISKTKLNLASAYMKQNKFQQAEQLYKEIINELHQEQFGPISVTNKPIWQLAEDKQSGNHASINAMGEAVVAMYQKASRISGSSAHATLKNLSTLYRRRGMFSAAETIENCCSKESGQSSKLPAPVSSSNNNNNNPLK